MRLTEGSRIVLWDFSFSVSICVEINCIGDLFALILKQGWLEDVSCYGIWCKQVQKKFYFWQMPECFSPILVSYLEWRHEIKYVEVHFTVVIKLEILFKCNETRRRNMEKDWKHFLVKDLFVIMVLLHRNFFIRVLRTPLIRSLFSSCMSLKLHYSVKIYKKLLILFP